MSKPDFRNGLNITDLSKERSERAERIHSFMKEQSNNRKTGKAETGRLAIDLAWEMLEALEEEEEETKSDLRQVMDFKNKVIDRLD